MNKDRFFQDSKSTNFIIKNKGVYFVKIITETGNTTIRKIIIK